jgi:hypothetical protein
VATFPRGLFLTAPASNPTRVFEDDPARYMVRFKKFDIYDVANPQLHAVTPPNDPVCPFVQVVVVLGEVAHGKDAVGPGLIQVHK